MTTTRPGMTLIPGGTCRTGSDNFYPEERPRRKARVDAFWIDDTAVTNRAFAEFVAATGYVTVAEIPPDPRLYPDLDPEFAVPASLVFQRTATPVPLDRSEEHTSELQSLMRISYAVFCLKKKKNKSTTTNSI